MIYTEQLYAAQQDSLDRAREQYLWRICFEVTDPEEDEEEQSYEEKYGYPIEEDDGTVRYLLPARDGFVDPLTGIYYPPVRR